MHHSKQFLIFGVASIKETILICIGAAVMALVFYVFHLFAIGELRPPF